MEIAVVPSTRSALRQSVVGQYFQPDRAQFSCRPTRRDDVRIVFGSRSAHEPGAIRLFRQRRTASRNDTENVKRRPGFFLLSSLLFPSGDFALDLLRVEGVQQRLVRLKQCATFVE